MTSLSERHRNNIRAGVFVSVAILIGLFVLIALTDFIGSLRRSTDSYTVTFDVASGVANLKSGSDVRVGGVTMGDVTEVLPKLVEGQAFREIAVEFTVDRRIEIFANAQVLVKSPLIGSEAWLEISSVGDPGQGKPPNGQLMGTPSVGLLTSLLGTENADKADEMVENARVFSDFLATIPVEYNNRLAPALDDIQSSASDVRHITNDLRQTRWPSWAEHVDRVLTWAETATGQLDAAIAQGNGLLSDSRTVVQENRDSFKSIVSNLESTSRKVNEETIDKVHAFLQSGQNGLDRAASTLQRLQVDYEVWATDIGEALASANLAAQQLKLTMIETRRSPWKVLYRPSSDELEHELLYEATRSFAVAAADLKSASESIQRVLDHHADEIRGDEETYRRLERNLLESLAKYEKAQQQLLDVLVSDEGGKD
jgi:ABC-type transporter Mla subunit MlaD